MAYIPSKTDTDTELTQLSVSYNNVLQVPRAVLARSDCHIVVLLLSDLQRAVVNTFREVVRG